MATHTFKYYQPNDKIEDNSSQVFYDDVIRALTVVTDKDWLTVFDELVAVAREMQCMPDKPKCIAKYLESYGYYPHIVKHDTPFKHTTIDDIACNEGTVIFQGTVGNGWMACKDGCLYNYRDFHGVVFRYFTKAEST